MKPVLKLASLLLAIVPLINCGGAGRHAFHAGPILLQDVRCTVGASGPPVCSCDGPSTLAFDAKSGNDVVLCNKKGPISR